MPEPELSHFEPSTGMISTNGLEHYDECNQIMENNSKFSNKKLNKKLNINAINNNKRVFNDFIKEEIVEEAEDYPNHYQNNEIDEFKSNSCTKKFKPEYNKNSKKQISKKLRDKNLFHESNKCDGQYLHNKDNDLDEHFNESNISNNNNNNNVYYSEDENSIDENLNEDSSVESKTKNHLVSNSSPSSSISSSMTSDTALSLSPTSSNKKNSHLLMASNLAPPISNEFFSNLFSNFPSSSSADLHTKLIQETNANSANQFNNIAAALIQRLSTAALFQQFNANNGTNKSNENTNQMIASLFSNKQQQVENNYIHSSDNRELSKQLGKSPPGLNHELRTHEFDMKDLKVKVLNGCALDLSLKSNSKKPKHSESNETNDEYFSALSPVSTSSTNLSTSSLSSFCNSNNKKSDDKLFANKLSPEQTTQQQQNKKSSNKAIVDVINRLKSKSKLSDESDAGHTPDALTSPKTDNESHSTTAADEAKYNCKHNLSTPEADTNLEELNDLIKSHLLPISAAVYEKYKNYFVKLNNNKNSAKSEHDSDEDKETRKDLDDELEESDFQEISFADKSVSESLDDKTNVDLNSKKCTFCKILKNLIDLHQLLHKT